MDEDDADPAPSLTPVGRKPLVRPGQTVTLLWDQDGIRLTVPAVSLDRGGAGEASTRPHRE